MQRLGRFRILLVADLVVVALAMLRYLSLTVVLTATPVPPALATSHLWLLVAAAVFVILVDAATLVLARSRQCPLEGGRR